MGDQRRFRVNPEPLAVVPSDPFERERYLAERAQARALRAEAERDAFAGRVQAVEAELECAKESLVYIWEKEDRLRAERDALAERVERLREALMDYASLDPGDEPWTVPLWQPARDALRADDEARGTCSPCHGTGVIDCSPGPVSDCDYCGGTGRA